MEIPFHEIELRGSQSMVYGLPLTNWNRKTPFDARQTVTIPARFLDRNPGCCASLQTIYAASRVSLELKYCPALPTPHPPIPHPKLSLAHSTAHSGCYFVESVAPVVITSTATLPISLFSTSERSPSPCHMINPACKRVLTTR